MKFRVSVQVVDDHGNAWFGEPPSRSVPREEVFEAGYEPTLGRLIRMLAAQAELAHAEQQWAWGEGDE